MRHARAVVTALAALSLATPAFASKVKVAKSDTPVVPTCARKLGTVAIAPPDNQWWRAYELGNPENLIKVIVRQSGCFNIVNRGAGLAMRGVERDLGGELQRGSNVGLAQVKTADYFLIPDIVGANSNSGGNAVGAGLGGLLGGTVGGLLGGIRTKKLTAQTVLTLVNARTTEEIASAEGNARKTDIGFGAGGFLGFGGAVGGGYENTEIGRIITRAYVEAYTDLVTQVQGETPELAAAPQKAWNVVRATPMLNKPGGRPMKQLKAGDVVYPTGERSGVLVKVADEFDIEGWVTTEAIRG